MVFVKDSEIAPRSYRSAVREEQAERTRERIARAARKRFIESGWSGTSVRSVAADAGVSEATVYAVYGTKAGLAGTLIDSGEMDAGVAQAHCGSVCGRGRSGGAARSLRRASTGGSSNAAATVSASPRGTPQRAGTRGRLRPGSRPRRRGRRRCSRTWPAEARRKGVTVDRALDVYAMVCSIEIYDIATQERGWSADDVERWWLETLTDRLLA